MNVYVISDHKKYKTFEIYIIKEIMINLNIYLDTIKTHLFMYV